MRAECTAGVVRGCRLARANVRGGVGGPPGHLEQPGPIPDLGTGFPADRRV